jgi:hypothetical protein
VRYLFSRFTTQQREASDRRFSGRLLSYSGCCCHPNHIGTTPVEAIAPGARKNPADGEGECVVDDRPDEIEDHIKSTQRELGSNLQELENKVKDATDWRVQFERHPMALLGAAFAGGILLSAGLGGRRRGGDDPGSHVHAPNLSMPSSRPAPERKSAPSDIWNNIKGALVAAAGTQMSTVLGDSCPAFVPTRALRCDRMTQRSDHRRHRLLLPMVDTSKAPLPTFLWDKGIAAVRAGAL